MLHLLKLANYYIAGIRHQPIMLIFSPIMLCCSAQNFDLLCYAAVLKILTYYAQYYAHVCLKFDCSIRVCSQNY